MKHLFFILFSIFCTCSIRAQFDFQVWPMGINEFANKPGSGNTVVKLGKDTSLSKVINMPLNMNFESTMAAATDAQGNLLFYTNGCHIATADGDTMPNGAGLNPGDMHERTCPKLGYASPLGAMILQQPGRPNIYYLFHEGIDYEKRKKLTYGPLYYTVINMEQNGGKGAVLSKNNILVEGDLEPFTAVRHGNGRDWWITVPHHGSNRYTTLLFSKQGVQVIENQNIGPVMDCPVIGSSTYAHRGDRYARRQDCRVVVMDFDRCSGRFSSPLALDVPPMAFGGGGVAFSPDGSTLFVTVQLAILSVQVKAASPVLDTLIDWQQVAGNSLHMMQYGPDDKIYISQMSRSPFYHVFDPATYSFTSRGLLLPATSVRTLPNIPNHRLGDLKDSPCDTLGINALFEPPKEAFALMLSPNPASDWLVLQSEISITAIQVLDLAGREIIHVENPGNRLNISTLQAGSYLLKAYNAEGRYVVRQFVVGR
jgi:hypothetical protein